MKKNSDKKGVAPEEYGDLPNEKRCINCASLLRVYENMYGVTTDWCKNCQIFYDKEGKPINGPKGTLEL